jgi:16S rRNA U516 pseudouridylate synthase RsuA-like enzyme
VTFVKNDDDFRLAKVIARAGFCSRRRAERLIERGSVKVDGKTVRHVVTFVDPTSADISVEGVRVTPHIDNSSSLIILIHNLYI